MKVDARSRELARLWIHAIVLGAAADTVGYVIIVMLSRMLGVSDPESGPLVMMIFISLAGAIVAATTAVFGVLTGRVLECRLPDLPTRNWIAAHALMGFVFGLVVSVAFTSPEEPEPWTAEWIRFYAIGTLVIALMLGLLMGCVQAFVLRRTAHGLRLWMVCSALAGLCYLLRVPIDIYGPQTGIANELVGNGAGFLASVAHGFVLVPAMLRLRPQGAHPIPILFE